MRVVGIHRPLPHERLGHRDPRGAGELAERRRGAAPDHAVAGQRHRVERAADEVGGLEQLAGRRLRAHRLAAGQRLEVLHVARHHVLGQLDVCRARLLALRDLEGLADDLRDDVRVRQLRVPLGDRTHHALDVDVLVRLLVHPLEVALTGERDHRRAVEVGVRHRRDEVHRARPERAEADARAAGQPPPDVGHVGRALLVAHRHELDRRVRERFVQVERLLPGDPENVLHALGLEALDEDV